ncbi:Calmodulin-binding transcription activator 5-like protein [Drosera capensis]
MLPLSREYQHLANSPLYCICGEESVPVEAVQAGVFRCLIPAHGLPGLVNFYLSIDRSSPVSQVLSFEFRSHVYKNVVSTEEDSNWEECQFQIRLAHLLFSTSKSLDIFSRGPSRITTKDATKFFLKTLTIDVSSWAYLIELIRNGKMLLTQAKESLLELTLKNKLNEWLLERLMYRDSIIERDEQGQGVLHLCAILGYVWAVYPFTLSGLSLDFRDKFGWTALHWAAYYGREQMVAALLSAGAKPNLVTDPTPENPGGCTPGDIAIVKGYEGLAAFLSEKALVQQFNDMKLAGHASGSLETATSQGPSANEEDNSLHDALAASRMAADAAARIQAAFREHSFKLRTKAVESSNPEMEARNIIAAMKIQQAFRNYEGRKKMAAAAHIQGSYRTWKLRTEFLNKRRHAIRIQAAFRGFQMRKQYRKILWSVGFLEKAILRWRLKRKGLRGLHVGPTEPITSQHQGNATEEDFFRASRQQAEERVERAVVRVQAMFRSKKAQEEYRRMKLTHIQAKGTD